MEVGAEINEGKGEDWGEGRVREKDRGGDGREDSGGHWGGWVGATGGNRALYTGFAKVRVGQLLTDKQTDE